MDNLNFSALMDAIQRKESSADPYTNQPTRPLDELVSGAGARGVMQVKPDTAMDAGYGVPSIFDIARGMGYVVDNENQSTARFLLDDPDVNRAFGENYMQAMLDRFGDVDMAVAAYNMGPSALQRRGAIYENMPKETQDYVGQVSQYYNQSTGENYPLTIAPRPKARPEGLLD